MFASPRAGRVFWVIDPEPRPAPRTWALDSEGSRLSRQVPAEPALAFGDPANHLPRAESPRSPRMLGRLDEQVPRYASWFQRAIGRDCRANSARLYSSLVSGLRADSRPRQGSVSGSGHDGRRIAALCRGRAFRGGDAAGGGGRPVSRRARGQSSRGRAAGPEPDRGRFRWDFRRGERDRLTVLAASLLAARRSRTDHGRIVVALPHDHRSTSGGSRPHHREGVASNMAFAQRRPLNVRSA